jgi:hypothetical protein
VSRWPYQSKDRAVVIGADHGAGQLDANLAAKARVGVHASTEVDQMAERHFRDHAPSDTLLRARPGDVGADPLFVVGLTKLRRRRVRGAGCVRARPARARGAS